MANTKFVAGPSGSSSSSSFLHRVVDRDASAWRRVADMFCPQVYSWARGAGLQPCDAADVMQATFLAAYKGIASFDNTAANATLRGWLWTITKSKIADHFRRRTKQPEAAGGSDAHAQLMQVAIPDYDCESTSAVGLATTAVRAILKEIESDFEPRTWKAFCRTALDGQEAEKVGREIGLKAGAVYVAKCRVLKRLRRELNDLIGPIDQGPNE